MKKKIVVFSGAGISAESGVSTFRNNNGLWDNYNIEEVATPQGWKKDREKVLKFYNERRAQLPTVQPNDAHKALVSLENEYDVTIVTQNVDDLHERAGSTNILHLHGELTKARGCYYDNKPSTLDQIYDIGYNEIKVGDKCEFTDSQLRPHIVWFGEYPFDVDKAYQAIRKTDILIIVGTSLQIGYTINLLSEAKLAGSDENPCEIYYVDPQPMRYLDNYGLKINYIQKLATEGITELVNNLLNRATGGAERNV